MEIIYHPVFEKSFKKRILNNKKLEKKFEERLRLFIINPQSPELHNHSLSGNMVGLCSFSITGDIRVIYHQVSTRIIRFLDIGTHNQVY